MALNFSFSKKGDAEPVVAPSWHPNFRDFARLPDTKVVRTTFFVNTAAIAAALALLLWLGYSEYSLHNLDEQIAAAQSQIDSNSKQNAEALKLSKAFADEQKKLGEVSAFEKIAISPTEFIGLLGKTLPKEISIDSVDMRFTDGTGGSVVQLRALVAGSSDQASGASSRYVDTLRADPRLGAIFDPITLTNLNRNANGGFLSVDISLKFKSDTKEKK